MLRVFCLAACAVAFLMTNVQAQCNSGVSTAQAQVSANQQLVLQQTAAIAAQQQRQVNVSVQRSVGQPLSLQGQTTCTACQQNTPLELAPGQNRGITSPVPAPAPQVARAVPPTPVAPPAMMFVRMTPSGSTSPQTDSARYVLMTSAKPESYKVAAR